MHGDRALFRLQTSQFIKHLQVSLPRPARLGPSLQWPPSYFEPVRPSEHSFVQGPSVNVDLCSVTEKPQHAVASGFEDL